MRRVILGVTIAGAVAAPAAPAKVTCSNTSGHGFTIGNGKYKSF